MKLKKSGREAKPAFTGCINNWMKGNWPEISVSEEAFNGINL